MIPHLKALIQGFQNQQKNWAWHHPEGGHAPLSEKALLLHCESVSDKLIGPFLKWVKFASGFREWISQASMDETTTSESSIGWWQLSCRFFILCKPQSFCFIHFFCTHKKVSGVVKRQVPMQLSILTASIIFSSDINNWTNFCCIL